MLLLNLFSKNEPNSEVSAYFLKQISLKKKHFKGSIHSNFLTSPQRYQAMQISLKLEFIQGLFSSLDSNCCLFSWTRGLNVDPFLLRMFCGVDLCDLCLGCFHN